MLITFGLVNVYMCFSFIAGFLYFIRQAIYNILCKHFSNGNQYFPFLFRVMVVISGDCLIILAELLSICKRRNKEIHNGFTIEIKKSITKYKKEPFLILILISASILELVGITFNAYILHYYQVSKDSINSYALNLLLARIVGFIILSFLCKLIFNTNIYSHHYLGVSIIILYYIILILISPVIFSWYSLLLIVGTTIFECLDIVYKWLMDIKYISPYELSGFKGIFLTIILLILNASLQNVPCKSDSFIVFLCPNTVTITDFNNSFSRLYEDGIKAILLLFFGSFLCSTFYTMLNFLTIKYLGPIL